MTADEKLDQIAADVRAILIWQAGREERITVVERVVDELGDDVAVLQRWRWMVLGGAVAASLVIDPLISWMHS